LRNKSSISSFGPAQKVNANTTAPAKKPTATVKAGAKRTALGGVVANGQKDELMDDAKASGKSSPPPPDGL
jgi:G2/mitotic-specific cyclin 1/2